MSLCAACGLENHDDECLCRHHTVSDFCSEANRIMCDFFHRGKVPPRLSPSERDDDFWAHAGEAYIP